MDPQPPTTWWSAVLATATSVWQAFIVPAALGFFAFYKFKAGRQDQQASQQHGGDIALKTTAMTYEQQLQAALLAAGVSEKENLKWVVEEHRRILARCEEDKDEGWAERDRWNRIAGYCYWRLRDAMHDLDNARQMAIGMAHRLKRADMLREDEVPSWPVSEKLPDMDSIYPKQAKEGSGLGLPT